MDTFQKGVLFSAIIILLISLIFIGLLLGYAKDETWPPVVSACPDYWTMNKLGKCVNDKNLGTCNIPTKGNPNSMDFTGAGFTGDNGDCAKYTWARGCGVTWDGINSGVSNPCTKDTSDS